MAKKVEKKEKKELKISLWLFYIILASIIVIVGCIAVMTIKIGGINNQLKNMQTSLIFSQSQVNR